MQKLPLHRTIPTPNVFHLPHHTDEVPPFVEMLRRSIFAIGLFNPHLAMTVLLCMGCAVM